MRNLDYELEEIEALNFNIGTVVDKLQSGSLSTLGAIAAQELASVLIKSRDFLKDEKNSGEEADTLILMLPLLYFKIPKLN